MNFQQMQHNEESDYEYDDDERSLQTDDLSYLSSSYDTENEDGHDDDMSVKIGGNVMVDGEDNGEGEEEGEMELEGGLKMSFSRSSKPEYVVFERPDESYKYLHNRHAFNKIMSFCLLQSNFKTMFVNYINGNKDSTIDNLNDMIKNKYVKIRNGIATNGTIGDLHILDKSDYFKTGSGGIEELYDNIYNNKNYNNALDIKEDKIYLSDKFALELMFCLTHFINDGCTDTQPAKTPSHQKFKRRYEYRALFLQFISEYKNVEDHVPSSKKLYKDMLPKDISENPEKQKGSSPHQQKTFLKYLLILIAFETDMLNKKDFIKSFTIPDPSNAKEFMEMIKRILNLFSISQNIATHNIILQFYERSNSILKDENSLPTEGNTITIQHWLTENLLPTMVFYENMNKVVDQKNSLQLIYEGIDNKYFKNLKQDCDKSKLITHISNTVEVDQKGPKITDQDLFFLEYITGIKDISTPAEESKASEETKTPEPSQTNGVYFYNHSLPIIPYESGTESSSMTSPVSQVKSQSPTTSGVSEINGLQNGFGLV